MSGETRAVRAAVLRVAILLLAAAGHPLAAQEGMALAADSPPVRAMTLPGLPALPLELTPSSPAAADAGALDPGEKALPFLFALFGGIAGMFAADWWADRNCEENCGQPDIYFIMLGGMVGGIVGYLAGGGEMVDPGPGRRP